RGAGRKGPMRLIRLAHVILPLALASSALANDEVIPGRWTPERAHAWYQAQPWLVGCNFTPSTAINQLEMWQADTFDEKTIDRELGWAAGMGMNTVRVFLHDLLWQQDSAGLLQRIDRFLAICERHKIKPMLVFADACWNPHPALGKQPDPVPRVHNSGWVQSPHIDVLRDPARHASLEPYVRGVLGRFKDDPRVLLWDLYNEPGNDGPADGLTTAAKEEKGLLLLRELYRWARDVNPSQPLTTGVWIKEWSGDKVTEVNRFMLANSDVISFHCYENLDKLKQRVASLKPHGRPLLCTEYLARGSRSTFEDMLPYFKEERIAAYNWGLVAGKIQTEYPWSSIKKKFTAEPDPWHHDILRKDGTPYRQSEVELMRKLTGRGENEKAES
ncbi:MAG TPA: hypothetical protein VFY13_06025, partial [Luteolibacter sp.]|nr:hypothetical protein [Luteolibacter sp.]